jgi:DICT domain-containing protein
LPARRDRPTAFDETAAVEVSKHLEREALRLGKTCTVLSTFQDARHFGTPTARRYRRLADDVGFVAAIGAGLSTEPAAGVRGAALDPRDVLRGEWDIVVLAPHFAAALIARETIARETGPDTLPDLERTFEFVLTYDRPVVEAAAQSLMARVHPRSDP